MADPSDARFTQARRAILVGAYRSAAFGNVYAPLSSFNIGKIESSWLDIVLVDLVQRDLLLRKHETVALTADGIYEAERLIAFTEAPEVIGRVRDQSKISNRLTILSILLSAYVSAVLFVPPYWESKVNDCSFSASPMTSTGYKNVPFCSVLLVPGESYYTSKGVSVLGSLLSSYAFWCVSLALLMSVSWFLLTKFLID